MKSSGNVVKTTLNTHSHSVWWTQNSFSHLSIGKIKKQAWFRFLCNKTKSPIFCFLCISTTFKTCFWYNFIRCNVLWFCTILLQAMNTSRSDCSKQWNKTKNIWSCYIHFFTKSVYLSKWSKQTESYILYNIITDEFALFIY